jgi:phosphoglucosamine mutase
VTRKYFGTDGVRGKVGEAPITPEFALKLGWAAGKALARNGQSWVVMGKDTRLSGYLLESALEAGLVGCRRQCALAGAHANPCDCLSDPRFSCRCWHRDFGLAQSVLRQWHQVFRPNGMKLQDDVELSIEDWLDKPMEITAPDALGKAMRQEDARGRYIEFCKSSFPFHLSLRGLKIVLDCANGAAYQVGPSVFTELGAEVIKLACAPDGLNINRDCGSTHPETLQKAVVEHEADLGIAFRWRQ